MKKSKSAKAKLVLFGFLKIMLLFAIATAQTSQDGCQIDETLVELINNKVEKITAGTGGTGGDVFVCSLSFIDGITKTGFLSEEGKLIDEAVRDGMHLAAQQNNRLKIDESGHMVPNTAASVTLLVDVYFDPDLTQQEKYDTIKGKLLDPHKVDILMTGVIVDTGGMIQIRPFGVSRPDKTIKTKDIQFKNRDELFIKVNGTLSLTPKAHEEIQVAVKDILEET